MKLTAELEWDCGWRASLSVLLFLRLHRCFPKESLAGANSDFLGRMGAPLLRRLEGQEHWVARGPDDILGWIEREAIWPSAPDESTLSTIADELELRRRVLAESWMVRGPGWVSAFEKIGGLLGEIRPARIVRVVLPFGNPGCWAGNKDGEVLGFVGASFYDLDPQLPEWLRLSWLLARRQAARWLGDRGEGVEPAERTDLTSRSNLRLDLAGVLLVFLAAVEVDALVLDEDVFWMAVRRWVWSSSSDVVDDRGDGMSEVRRSFSSVLVEALSGEDPPVVVERVLGWLAKDNIGGVDLSNSRSLEEKE